MSFLKNKHMMVAMFVAPVLAILAYVATDFVVSEKPSAAKEGQSYRLAADSNCRYESGVCTLKNGDIELRLRAERVSENEVSLTLLSSKDIKEVLISFNEIDQPFAPIKMHRGEKNAWQANLLLKSSENSILRLVVDIAGSSYFAETSAVFVDFSTSFSRDNFSSQG